MQPSKKQSAAVLLLAMTSTSVVGQIYKSVAPDGTVIYSDQAPDPNAQPMELPELTVVASSRRTPQVSPREPDQSPAEPSAVPPRYEEFRLVQPTADQTYWNTGYSLTVQASNAEPLAPGHRVRFVVDGEPRGESETFSILLTEIYRGEHSVKAEVVNDLGDVVASTQPVTFHMKQTSVQR